MGCNDYKLNVKINGGFATLLQLCATLGFIAGTMSAKTCVGSFCADTDADSVDVTFGDDTLDGSAWAIIALILSLISFICCAIGLFKGIKAQFATATKLFGAALGFNVCYYIYMIEYEPVDGIKVSPGWGWGASCNIGAFINIVCALLNANQAKKLGGGPPTSSDASSAA